MTNKPLNAPYAVAPDLDANEILSDEYAHWTVADVIEMLRDHNPEARVWIADENFGEDDDAPLYLRPLEMIFGSDGEVVL